MVREWDDRICAHQRHFRTVINVTKEMMIVNSVIDRNIELVKDWDKRASGAATSAADPD